MNNYMRIKKIALEFKTPVSVCPSARKSVRSLVRRLINSNDETFFLPEFIQEHVEGLDPHDGRRGHSTA